LNKIEISRNRNIFYEVDENGCWNVISQRKDADGYPRVKRNGRKIAVHRYVYMNIHGEFPSNIVIRHKCDNRACCNPEHLIHGTNKDNMQDMVERGRRKGKAPIKKLNESQIKFIKKNIQLSSHELSRIFNVSRHTIKNVKIGKTYKNIN
jgi:DNA-binding transcriptional regulator YiaG